MWSPGITLEDVEKQVIVKAFSHFHQNKTVTANALGIAVRTLDAKLEKFEIDRTKEIEAREQRKRDNEAFLARQRGVTKAIPASSPDILSPLAGFRVESSSEASTQSDMPLPKRNKVQTVLPSDDAQGGQRGRRTAI